VKPGFPWQHHRHAIETGRLLVTGNGNLYSAVNLATFIKIYTMAVNLTGRITINPAVCHGKPTIRGLRYPVDTMLELLASGMTMEDILSDYPDLEKEDLLACIEYAAKLTQVKSIYRIAS
jgi:uncharacterized protein (DUF433 family)